MFLNTIKTEQIHIYITDDIQARLNKTQNLEDIWNICVTY